jgi:hypothetical protein
MFADANCISKRNANGYCHSYAYDYSNCYVNSDRYGYRHTERYGYSYRDSLSDSDGHGQANAYCAA